MTQLWLVLVEVNDDSSPSKIGFMNVTTWAESEDDATNKIQRYLESLGWNLISVEKTDIIDEEATYAEEVIEMISRAHANADAIILGTFHTYKPN
jgi:hypothetical protein